MVIKEGIRLLLGRTSRDEAYSKIRFEVNRRLQSQYAELLLERKAYYDGRCEKEEGRCKKVWVCWLQGFDKAPELVQACLASMKRWLTDREIIQLDYNNYTDYVSLPDFIVQKYVRGQIPPALFSDLIRLEVLVKYGGTWMDASVLCTGQRDVEVTMDCDLFMYQTKGPGAYRFHGASNWFITACKNNRPLMVLRDVLYQYWRDHSVTLDYYMFHDFFYAIAQMYPEEVAAMPRKNRLLPLMMMERMGYPYDAAWMKELTDHVGFHKLSYRIPKNVMEEPDNFYHVVIQNVVCN